ncbi:vomeronasal type-2 receptor 116-like, partial [Protopterus annectens]|uniref:vomeronasal type-2 receptor 116-like n=1 Tax=Protopterus annectens TaxID=7888 RepID=UPI001CFA5495
MSSSLADRPAISEVKSVSIAVLPVAINTTVRQLLTTTDANRYILEVLHYVRNAHFLTNTGGDIYFDENGDAVTFYDITNVQVFPDESYKFEKVGKIDPRVSRGEDIKINISRILWNERYTQIPRSVCSESCSPGHRRIAIEGQPICCFSCVPCSKGEIANETNSNICLKCSDDQWSNERHDECILRDYEFLAYEDPLGTSLMVIAVIFCLLTASILCIFMKHRDTPIVKANNRGLSYLLLLALMFCFLCSLLFIGYPREITCMLRQTVFGIIFSISVSSVLAKTVTVVIAFKATHPNSRLRYWVGSTISTYIVIICSLIQVLLCIIWLLASSPFPEFNTRSQNTVILVECNEGMRVFFYAMLGYMGLLAIICLVLAYLVRNLPDTFNEAKYISFSMLVFISVWLSFIPAYLSTQGKFMVAVEIFAILCSSFGLLSCIFFSKCYIILLKPEQNSCSELQHNDTK